MDNFLSWIVRGKLTIRFPFAERFEIPPKITLANNAVLDRMNPDLFNLSIRGIIPSKLADIANKGCKFSSSANVPAACVFRPPETPSNESISMIPPASRHFLRFCRLNAKKKTVPYTIFFTPSPILIPVF